MSVVLEITVISKSKRKTYKVVHEEDLGRLIAFFQGNILPLSKGRQCLYFHEKRHEEIPLLTKSGEIPDDLYELEGLVIDLDKGEVYEFFDVFNENYKGEGYKVYHRNFSAIVYYSLDWSIPPIKALFIRRLRRI
ncbi:MAG: hypothetical protein DRP01_00715 [Archaeoglobales archaeon]|nr:MAG: hypothetical protein DRP01_00715 [Archaeoglobales archaeon]